MEGSRRSRRGTTGKTNRSDWKQQQQVEEELTYNLSSQKEKTPKKGTPKRSHSSLGLVATPEHRPLLDNEENEAARHTGSRAKSRASRSKSRAGTAVSEWRKVRVGKVIDNDKRANLLNKVEKAAERVRHAFLETNTDGDASLDRQEVRLMMLRGESSLTEDELVALEDYIWRGDTDGDGTMSYVEFVNHIDDFVEQLRVPKAKAESYKAYAKLVQSGLLRRLMDNRKEMIRLVQANAGPAGWTHITISQFKDAISRLEGLKLSKDEIECVTMAANQRGTENFNPVDFFLEAAARFGEYADLADANFGRGKAHGVESTTVDDNSLSKLRDRALSKREQVQPLVQNIRERMMTKVGGSIMRAFRAMDMDKSGHLNAAKLKESMYKFFNVTLSEEQANDLVDSCDINGDGHVAFVDFIQLFHTEDENFGEQDIGRIRRAASDSRKNPIPFKGQPVPERAQPCWISQFHQGDWDGPFAVSQSCPSFQEDSLRFSHPVKPQYVEYDKLCDPLAHTQYPKPHIEPRITWNLDDERHRAQSSIEKAKWNRKHIFEQRIDSKRNEEIDKIDKRYHANLEVKQQQRKAWMDRLLEQFDNGGKHAVGKGLREPQTRTFRHAFYCKTHLHYYQDGFKFD